MSARAPLPIDSHLPAVGSALRDGNLVLVAEPGAGKTTRVPQAVVEVGGRVVVLEPRRLAARAAARRVAEEMGTRVGGAVGYEVRFDRQVGPDTRVLFMTEGLLARRLMSDPDLVGVGTVLVDEFHERHLTGDLTLALLRRAQRTSRPDLRLGVLSATIDPAPVAAFLDCPVLAVPGRVHPVAIEHAAHPPDGPLEREVARAVGRLAREGLDGHVLVFLPGAGEIRRAITACGELASRHDLVLLPLHGSLPPAEQDLALAPSARRKIVFATNVAETSITIDGVAAVVDVGTARIARHAPWSGLGGLRVEPISRASAAQRAGRAGRTRPGRCLRLYTRHDHDTRREFDLPEVLRADLAEAVLALHAAGVAGAFEWFEAPPPASLSAAEALLERLGALEAGGKLSEVGRRMMRFPLHPRQARVLVEAERRGVADEGCLVAAALSEEGPRRRGAAAHSSPSDVLDRVDSLASERGPAVRAAAQLRRLVDRSRVADQDRDGALMLALLTGFPDRVARRRRAGAPELLLCASAGGGAAVLHAASAVRDPELVVAVDAEEQGRGQSRQVSVRAASAVDPAWLFDLYLDRIADTDELRFDPAAERIERIRRLSYDGLVLEETREIDPGRLDLAAAGAVLARAARAAGLDRFFGAELARLRARIDLIARASPNAGIEPVADAELEEIVAGACREGATSFADLRAASLLDRLWRARGTEQRRALDRLAPESVSLPGRKRVPVHYEPDRPPWIESRLQDFFGLKAGPAVAGGAVPLVLHLLAPNKRAVQITSDLARFWEVHYPSIRRELSRRYPKHAWPEDPK
ncbi:MAG TPA: ATP-dependent helicase HrpB [Kofleriaceae bacterium]|nr:ATP-dependent helicase HrpB [Kofleriaceae bacterium]